MTQHQVLSDMPRLPVNILAVLSGCHAVHYHSTSCFQGGTDRAVVGLHLISATHMSLLTAGYILVEQLSCPSVGPAYHHHHTTRTSCSVHPGSRRAPRRPW